jgi:hypothetical protein
MDMSPSTAPSPMSSMDPAGGTGGMGGMGGTNILPPWVDALWMVALAAVLVFHCMHLTRADGQRRWFHLAHITMIIGMVAMYALVGYDLNWVPQTAWMWLYFITTTSVLGWMVIRFAQQRPFSYLWFLALVHQAAMFYMWSRMSDGVAWVSYGLAIYFLIETLAWLLGLGDDARPGRANAVGPGDPSAVVSLSSGSWPERISMAILAASMGYMFLGMQLMV